MTMSMDVARCRDLSRRDFAREYLAPSPRPVILTDALSNWGALGKWTPDYFGEHYGTTLPRCTEPNWLDSRLFPSRESLKYFERYIGGRGAAFPVLHYDGLHTHAFIMEIYGEKEFWVYPPEQTAFVYPRPGPESNKSQIDDIEHPDLERFPLFAQAKGTRFLLKAGETLFVPAGWWHTTRMLTAAISVSVNSADAANWRAFKQDYCTDLAQERGRLRATITSAYLGALGGLYSGLEFLNLFD